MNLTKLNTPKERYIADAKDLLIQASDREFEAVFIVGLQSDGTVWAKKSATQDTLKFLGVLEFAKSIVTENWK